MKGWRDAGLYAAAVNRPTHPRHDDAMVVHSQGFRAYKPGDVVHHALDYNDYTDDVDTVICDRAFEWFNVGELTNPVVAEYRRAGNRSLSVGDVVVVDDRAYTCASFGWERIEFQP